MTKPNHKPINTIVDEEGKMKICVWPCGTWCPEHRIEEYEWMSDDYIILHVPVELDNNAVDSMAYDMAEVIELIYELQEISNTHAVNNYYKKEKK
jgi:hypothetical protein